MKILNILKTYIPQFYEIPVLIYHSIDTPDSNSIPLGLFKQHMQFFKENGYRVILINKLIEIIKEREKTMLPAVCFTFDDGYADTFNLAYPVLREYGFPAAIFVVVNKINQRGYLNFEQMNKMVAEGLITIGSHTMNHTSLLHLNDKELFYEITESKNVLEDNLKCKIDLFSYPWGGFSKHIQIIVRQSGYKAAFSTNSRIDRDPKDKDLYALRRITMSAQDSPLRFLAKVSGFGTCFARKINPAPHLYRRGFLRWCGVNYAKRDL